MHQQISSKVDQQISGTAIGTKFTPSYTCKFMDQVESKFMKTQSFNLLSGLGALMIFSSSELLVKKVSKI